MRCNHLALVVADLDRSAAFYERWFGFGPAQPTGDGSVWLLDAEGFDLTLMPGTPAPSGFHFGFELESAAEVWAAAAAMEEAGVRMAGTTEEEGFTQAKVLDPDGYGIDLSWSA